jgi:4-hydroxy-4-methyl-2-oxoglutarate aldolase
MSGREDPRVKSAVGERLAALDSCAVSDALDALGLAGAVAGVGPMTVARCIAGRVLTVELGAPAGAAPGRHLCTAAIEAARPGDVIVVAHQGRSDCAGWGGNLSRAAARRGVVATIVHGAVRDVDESKAVGYPVYATSATPRTARGRAEEVSWGEPVDLGSVRVSTGDFVVADGSGVVFITAADIKSVLESAEYIVRREAAMAALLDQGEPAGEVLGADYEILIRHAGGDK